MVDQFNNLYIIGTSHISSESINQIKKAFEDIKPDILAVELDRQRLHGLLAKDKGKPSLYDIKRVGLKGFLFALIGSWASNKLGKVVGIKPGSEMKSAVLLAKKNKTKVALIDQDIEKTLKRFSSTFSWKERWNIVVDIFNAIILRKKDPLLKEIDLRKVPEEKIIKQMVSKVKKRYPNLYKVIIEERNYYMARKLKKLSLNDPSKKILVVIGAGHKEDILDILEENEGITYSFSVSNI